MSFVEELQARGVVVSGFIATGYERKEVYPVHAVLNHLGESSVDFGGDIISVVSLRYQTFAKDLCCVRCGLKGLYFAKERGARFRKKRGLWESLGGKYHFNLYGLTAEGKEVMLTKDHILPASKGGKDHIDNMQTMCKTCNEKKSDDLTEAIERGLIIASPLPMRGSQTLILANPALPSVSGEAPGDSLLPAPVSP